MTDDCLLYYIAEHLAICFPYFYGPKCNKDLVLLQVYSLLKPRLSPFIRLILEIHGTADYGEYVILRNGRVDLFHGEYFCARSASIATLILGLLGDRLHSHSTRALKLFFAEPQNLPLELRSWCIAVGVCPEKGIYLEILGGGN